jgi:predicted nucleotidyltransferase
MLSDLIRLADAGSGAVQREVERLGRAGIINVSSAAGRKYVQANKDSPIFSELRGVVEKTSGVEAQLRAAVESVNANVRFAILFGSVAKGTDTAASDIDVLIVSDDLTQEAAFRMFQDTERRLGRTVNPTIYTSDEFVRRRRSAQPFLTKVLSGHHTILAGNADEL